MNFLKNFPSEKELILWSSNLDLPYFHKVNCHVHTPYSFSAFESIDQIFRMANDEDVVVVGINDFFVTDGYDEFYKKALSLKVFPEFNIEFIGLLKEEQKKGIRVNDPNNPGRTYFCGKGLDYPFHLSEENKRLLNNVIISSQLQLKSMIDKLNDILQKINSPFLLDFEEIKEQFAKELVRERHIAKAIRFYTNEYFSNDDEKRDFYNKLFNEKSLKANLSNFTEVEEEIRANLLKAGGIAFVPETEEAFLPIEIIIDIIIDAGGIPCYPVLLDDKNGNFTEFEKDITKLINRLKDLKVSCIEVIPNRNSIEKLNFFVEEMSCNDFVVLAGSEHNTPAMIPLSLKARNGDLNEFLLNEFYEGACIIAAHQYLKANNKIGVIMNNGQFDIENKEYYIELGNAIINYYKNN